MPTFKTRYGPIIIYKDSGDNTPGIYAGYKGVTQMDAAAFYTPYIPLQTFDAGAGILLQTRDWWVRVRREKDFEDMIVWATQSGFDYEADFDDLRLTFKSESDFSAFILRWIE